MPALPNNLALWVQHVSEGANRAARHLFLDGFQTVSAAETLNTLSFSAGFAAPSTGQSYSVPAGKTLRIHSIVAGLYTLAGNTTPVTVAVRLRVNTAGAAVIGSPIALVFALEGVTLANDGRNPGNVDLPGGIEIPGGSGVGITTACFGWVTTTAAPVVNLSILAAEF